MTEILTFFFIVGARLTDTLEVWILLPIVLVIVIDFVLGFAYQHLLAFGVLQVVYITGGFAWAYWTATQQDVSGPYAWALVVGVWCIVTVVYHIVFVGIGLTKKT